MTMSDVYQNDIGTQVIVEFTDNAAALDITSADATLRMKKPSGAVAVWDLTHLNSTGGTAYYTTASSTDLDEAGRWIVQGRVLYSPAEDWVTELGELNVGARISIL